MEAPRRMNMGQAVSAPGQINGLQRLLRAGLLGLGMSGLVTGVWGGLLRMGWVLPMPVSHANWITYHGPLMVCGFLGTLIGLERAVGLRLWWTYGAPLLVGVGGVLTEAGVMGWLPHACVTAGSAVFVGVTIRILCLQRTPANVVQLLGACSWLVGNVGWMLDRPLAHVVPAWMGFLLLIIAGERLELTRFQRLVGWANPALTGLVVWLGLGLVLEGLQAWGRGLVLGGALVGFAGWLLRLDLAWRTLRAVGLPRYMAVCLLSGYGWLLVSGGWLAIGWPQTAGAAYDGMLHAFFVGFVFAMIFAHAPVIFPAVLGVPVVFHPVLYGWWGLLQGTLALRLLGDGTGWAAGRAWGAAGNGIAMAGFLITMLTLWVREVWRRRRDGRGHSG
jgi:hypothetical protein